MDIPLKVIIQTDPQDGYRAEVPGLPGLQTEGATVEQLHANLCEALADWLATTQGAALDRRKGEPARVVTWDLEIREPCPFCLDRHVPNAETIAAMKEADEGKNLTCYENFEDLVKAMMDD